MKSHLSRIKCSQYPQVDFKDTEMESDFIDNYHFNLEEYFTDSPTMNGIESIEHYKYSSAPRKHIIKF